MKINFILPFVHPGGGVRVVFEHSLQLQQRGHLVRIYYPGGQGATTKNMNGFERIGRKSKYYLQRNLLRQKEENWFDHPLPIQRIPDLSARYLKPADIIIATSNETADWVKDYPEQLGKKIYLIQDYETWSRDSSLVDQTWFYPLTKIAISQWLVDLGRDSFNQNLYGPVTNGLQQRLFYPDPVLLDQQKTIDVLFMYRSAPQKGCERGLQILKKIKKENPTLQFSFIGRDEPPKLLEELGPYHRDPAQTMIRKLYSEARIFFLPSFQEGFAGPPLEAMACGCCVVSTRVGGPMDYIEDGVSGLLAKPEDSAELENKLRLAIQNPTLRVQFSQAGQEVAKTYTWEAAGQAFSELLQKIHANEI